MTIQDIIQFDEIWDKLLEEATQMDSFKNVDLAHVLLEPDDSMDEHDKAMRGLFAFTVRHQRPPINLDECTIDDKEIWFVFGEDGIDANESDTQGSFYAFMFRYSLSDECFDYYGYEQG